MVSGLASLIGCLWLLFIDAFGFPILLFPLQQFERRLEMIGELAPILGVSLAAVNAGQGLALAKNHGRSFGNPRGNQDQTSGRTRAAGSICIEEKH